MEMTNKNAVVLLSGGLDSLVSIADVKKKCDNILALTFDYGQKAFEKEYDSSSKIAKFYNIKHEVIKLDWLNKISGSTLNTKEEIPKLEKTDLNDIDKTKQSARSVWVPNRNALFVNIAACYCESLSYNYIVLGANKEEGATFKDNTQNFVDAINLSLKNSLNTKVELIAPLINMTKTEIVKYGIELGIPFEYIHSCYISSDKNCSKCESCIRLRRALEQNGRHDIIKMLF